MKTAISNLAWPKEQDRTVYSQLAGLGLSGIEIAPSRIWENPTTSTTQARADFLTELEGYSLEVLSLQSLLFGYPELVLFGSENSRTSLGEYLNKMIDLAASLGAPALVFGSPKNRVIGDQDPATARAAARDFFKEVGAYAATQGVCVCIEPNPAQYGTDFLNTTAEAVAFVKEVDSPGIRVNIDLGAIAVNGENMQESLTSAIPYAGHLHISEPSLAPIRLDHEYHQAIAQILIQEGYAGAVSIEMAQVADPAVLKPIISLVQEVYGA